MVSTKYTELLTLAEANGIVNRKGAWYALGDTQLGQGRDKAASRLLEDDAIREQLTSRLHSTLDLKKVAA